MATHRPVGTASLVATTAAVLLTTSIARGDPVRVEATRHGDRAQVVLAWPAPVGFSSEMYDGRLHVRFDRPVEGDFWAIRTLRRFTRLPTAGDDGTRLTFPLQREIEAVASADGTKVVIDFSVAKTRLAAAPASPVQAPSPELAAGEAIARRVNVSTGQHSGLSRVVFDWPEPVGYSVEGAPGTVTIVFDRPAEFDVRQFKRRDLKYIRGGETKRLGDRTKVTLKVLAGSSFRDMRENNKVVVEILAPSKSTAVAAPGTAGDPAAEPRPQPAGPALMQIADPPLLSASVATDPASASAVPTGEAASSSRASAPAVQPGRREASLRFTWDRPVAAAVFRRRETLWCVFDAPSKQDVAALAAAAGAGVRIEQQPHDQATVLSISGEAGLAPRLERQGLAWILRFAADGQAAASGQSITPMEDPLASNGPRLLLPVPEPGVPLAVADPEIGDTLVVVPVIPLSTRMAATYTYPQFLLQASLQGIVVQPLIDTLRVRSLRDGVEITSTDSLILSPPFDAAPMGGRPGAANDTQQRLLDAGDWMEGPATGFAGRRQALERAAMDSVGADRERNRLRLAQFLLGQRFAAEALGALKLAEEERPSLALEPKFLLLRGAAQLLSGRAAEAREDLARASLSGADEARLWAAATGVVVGEAPHDLSRIAQWTAITAGYPAGLRGPLSLWLAEAAIEGGAAKAEQLIGLATAEGNTPEARAQAVYLEGLRKQKAGDVEGALVSFEQAAGIDPRRGRARAELARTLLLRQQDRLSLEQAVASLENLRFAWRGDASEYRLLRELGRLYLQAGDYPAGLRSLKVALSDFPWLPGAAETTRDMARAFEQLFLEGAAERLSPVTALALYEEFRELTPSGDKGNEMVRRLAERLASVELLDRAASLLEGLLPHLSQPQKARLGAQLAEIRLRDGKPEAALADLRRTSGSDLPPDLQRQRALSQARALGTLGRGDDALLAIARDESVDAELLRAKLHRERGDWDRTAAALRRALQRARSDPAAALSEQHGRDVLDLAVALTLAGSDSQLADLDREYGAAMAATPLKNAFQLIAGGAPPAGADAAALADMVQKAMAFRKSLGPPAATAPAR